MTSACGVVESVEEQEEGLGNKPVDPALRAALMGQSPITAEFVLGENGVTLDLIHKVEKELASIGRHTYLYAPEAGEDFAPVVAHLNRAGILVLLVLTKEQAVAAEKADANYFTDWSEQGEAVVEDIVDVLRKKSSFSSYESIDRDYI